MLNAVKHLLCDNAYRRRSFVPQDDKLVLQILPQSLLQNHNQLGITKLIIVFNIQYHQFLTGDIKTLF